MDNPLVDKWVIDLTNRLDGIAFDGQRGVAVVLGEPKINERSEERGLLRYYGLEGGTLDWQYQITEREGISHIAAGYGAVLVGAGGVFRAIGEGGVPLWEYRSAESVDKIFFYGDAYGAIQISADKAYRLAIAGG
jgi:hypothetical protein